MSNEQIKKDSDSKKILTIVVIIAVLMVSTTGATYAYFALSATAPNNITGTAASGNISFSAGPTLLAPTSTSGYSSKPLVPQYAYNNSKNVLQLAVEGGIPSGSTKIPCVDANGNAICRVYTFTIKNGSTATVKISGTITFTGPSTNLRWAPMSNATTVASITSSGSSFIHTATTTATTFTDANATPNSVWSLAPNATKQFWVVFWINETGSTQTDSGTWTAALTFKEANGKGITSTITG